MNAYSTNRRKDVLDLFPAPPDGHTL